MNNYNQEILENLLSSDEFNKKKNKITKKAGKLNPAKGLRDLKFLQNGSEGRRKVETENEMKKKTPNKSSDEVD